MPLSDVACRGAKPGPKPYRKTDGGGLSLVSAPPIPYAARLDVFWKRQGMSSSIRLWG
jgi:hypothetical protein